MTAATLPATTTLGAVHLTVSDLERSLEYYTGRLGFTLRARAGDVAYLGAGRDDLLVLTGRPDAPRGYGTVGLYHFAVLVPERSDLARVLHRIAAQRTPIDGASDHGVSEALYLTDPDGLGIEIYRDRPRDDWPRERGQLRMGTDALNVHGLLAAAPDGDAQVPLPSGTRIGHVHLEVSELEPAERFYVDVLGFDLVQRYGGGASFVSAGGYHHHVGLNTWAGVGLPASPHAGIGLHHVDVKLPMEALPALEARARTAGAKVTPIDGTVEIVDPSGHHLRFGPLAPSRT